MNQIENLDKYLTTEFDNGYEKWVDQVWQIISTQYDISQDEIDDYWDKFFEPLTIKLSMSGTLPSGGCSPTFAASVIFMRWRNFKRDYKFLLPYMKQ